METEPVAARVNERVYDWLEEQAEKEATTIGRIVEDELRESYQEKGGSSDEDDEEPLPEGVYRPNSDKHNFAVKYVGYNGDTRRKYYKTRRGAVKKATRVKEDEQLSLSNV